MDSLEVLFDQASGSVSKTSAHVPVNRSFVLLCLVHQYSTQWTNG
ncbi:hypothetical protein [Marinomonas sp. IMCC 4694]|nr:hypothetical protein [Marinomonas sp. IMCC 4694]